MQVSNESTSLCCLKILENYLVTLLSIQKENLRLWGKRSLQFLCLSWQGIATGWPEQSGGGENGPKLPQANYAMQQPGDMRIWWATEVVSYQ